MTFSRFFVNKVGLGSERGATVDSKRVWRSTLHRSAQQRGSAVGRGIFAMDNGIQVVVVSFNTRDLTLRSIRSVLESTAEVSEVTVVDNASMDGSGAAVLRLGGPVRAVLLSENIGFGAANNRAVSGGYSEFIALVNSDAFVDAGCLERLREYLQRHPKVGVVGPELRNADGSKQDSCYRFPSPLRSWLECLGFLWLERVFKTACFSGEVEGSPSFSGCVDWLSGACLMIRRQAWMQVGGFDEGFFLYSEETDLQKRIGEAGWGAHFVSSTFATHLGGASGQGCSKRTREYFFSGVDRYFAKHHGRFGVVCFRAATALGAFLRFLVLGGAEMRANKAWLFKRQLLSPLPQVGLVSEAR